MNPGEQLIRQVAAESEVDAMRRLGTSLQGLGPDEVATRTLRYGPNRAASDKPVHWPTHLWHAWNSPFNYILLVIATLSWVTGDVRVVTVIAVMIVLSTLLPFTQELRSGNAAAALRNMVRTHAAVVRPPGGTESAHPTSQEVPLEVLVPGDIIQLAAGDMIPADVRILRATDLFVAQATLTGESAPVEKHAAIPANGALPLAGSLTDLPTMAFMGTSVVSGAATAMVVATGADTMFGAIAHQLAGREPMTSFDLGVRRVSWLLVRFMVVMVPVIFVVNGVTKGDWLQAFMFGLAVAVGLAPEMLPMIVSANLAKGAVAMSRRKTIVRHLGAIQNLGAMDVLCTDKTGTLTQDRIVLERYVDSLGREDHSVLELAYLVSANQTGLRNLLDDAVLAYASEFGHLTGDAGYQKLDEVPFDLIRRRMSVVVARPDEPCRLISKGAVEEVVAACTRVSDGSAVVPLTDARRRQVLDLVREQNQTGMRVVAVAWKPCPDAARRWSAADECDLVLAGFVCFLDPPKETAEPALRALRDRGITVRILTGDNDLVARKVCHDVHLDVDQVLLGTELEQLDDTRLDARVDTITVFAKLTPDQKVRVVRSFRRRGHTVGYLGDGINDAGALRESDVGISVDTAVDIARESADIILLEKDLLVLAAGVTEGRRIFANMLKYLKMTASSNFGNVLSVLTASVMLPFLPMLPVQLLAQNLLYDMSQVSIPWDNVDADYVAVPRRWNAGDIGRFMLRVGPVSSLFDLLTFGVLWYAFGANAPARQALFQSGWFVVGLLTQTLVVHMIRTSRVPFVQSRAAAPVLATTGAIMAVGMLIPFSPVAGPLHMTALPATFMAYAVCCAIAYAVTVQLVKQWYIAHYHEWL